MNIKVKIKEVRDELLLDRIQKTLENHENQQSLLEREDVEQIEENLREELMTLDVDPAYLTSTDAISGNQELKETILSVPNITNLIEGHSDTLTLEVWNPGDRSEPLYRETIQTNLFGEGSVVLRNFTTGTYDFTIHRDYVRRSSLNGIAVRTRTLFLDFTEEELKWGDFDNNLEINLQDILAFPSVDPKYLDIDENGSVNLTDFWKILQNWGSGD